MAQSSYTGPGERTAGKEFGKSSYENASGRDRTADAEDMAKDVASRMMEQGREVGEGMQAVAGNFKGAVDRSIKEQPMATLAMIAMAGFVLGAIWKS